MGEDFLCNYQPRGGAVIEPLRNAGGEIVWSAEAEQRLAQVPPFLRRMVRSRVEAEARRHGRDTVAADDMRASSERRLAGAGSPLRTGRFPGRWGGNG